MILGIYIFQLIVTILLIVMFNLYDNGMPNIKLQYLIPIYGIYKFLTDYLNAE